MDRRLTEADHRQAGFRTVDFWGFEIDLSRNNNSLLATMSSPCRWSIRKAAREGVIVEVADPDSFVDDYYPQFEDVMAKNGLVPTCGRSRVASLIRNLHPTGNLLLVRARDCNGTPIATGIFPAFNGTMYFWGGASWREHQHNQPNEALIWFAMQHWRAKGICLFDMGGGGEYKRKLGGTRIAVPWGRCSFMPGFETLRSTARGAIILKQRASNHLRNWRRMMLP